MRYVFVNKENFKLYRKYFSANEKFFNPIIRTPMEEYEKIIKDKTQITILMFKHNIFVGSITGYAHKRNSFYLFSVLILPRFQGRGYGRMLFKTLLNRLRRERYKYLKGHFNNISIRLLRGLEPPRIIKREKRWQNTTNEYIYLKVRL